MQRYIRREVFGIYQIEMHFLTRKTLMIEEAVMEVIPYREHFLFINCTWVSTAGIAVNENSFCKLNNVLLLTAF
jgi:hypothetical protein